MGIIVPRGPASSLGDPDRIVRLTAGGQYPAGGGGLLTNAQGGGVALIDDDVNPYASIQGALDDPAIKTVYLAAGKKYDLGNIATPLVVGAGKRLVGGSEVSHFLGTTTARADQVRVAISGYNHDAIVVQDGAYVSGIRVIGSVNARYGFTIYRGVVENCAASGSTLTGFFARDSGWTIKDCIATDCSMGFALFHEPTVDHTSISMLSGCSADTCPSGGIKLWDENSDAETPVNASQVIIRNCRAFKNGNVATGGFGFLQHTGFGNSLGGQVIFDSCHALQNYGPGFALYAGGYNSANTYNNGTYIVGCTSYENSNTNNFLYDLSNAASTATWGAGFIVWNGVADGGYANPGQRTSGIIGCRARANDFVQFSIETATWSSSGNT